VSTFSGDYASPENVIKSFEKNKIVLFRSHSEARKGEESLLALFINARVGDSSAKDASE
jgi:hypothetical protein